MRLEIRTYAYLKNGWSYQGVKHLILSAMGNFILQFKIFNSLDMKIWHKSVIFSWNMTYEPENLDICVSEEWLVVSRCLTSLFIKMFNMSFHRQQAI